MTERFEAEPTPHLSNRDYTGSAMLERARAVFENDTLTGPYTDPPMLDEAMRGLETLAAAEPGVFILTLGEAYDSSGVAIRGGGCLRGPVSLRYKAAWQRWDFQIPVRNRNYGGVIVDDEITHSPSSLRRLYSGETPLIIVGSEAVRACVASVPWHSLTQEVPQKFQSRRDVTNLYALYRATVPSDYLGLSHDDRARLFQAVMELIITDHTGAHTQYEAYCALQYLAQAETEEEGLKILEILRDQLATVMPMEDKPDSGEIIMTALDLARLYPPYDMGVDYQHIQEGDCQGAAFVAELYTMHAHALMAEGAGKDKLASPLALAPVQGPPEPRQLHVLQNPYPRSFEVHSDIVLLSQLAQSDMRVTDQDVIVRDYESMKRATEHILRVTMTAPDIADRVQSVRALEVLFDIQTDEQRDAFYHLLCHRTALLLDMGFGRSRQNVYYLAEAVAVCWPDAPLGPGAPRNAQSAAVMGHMWRCHAIQQLTREMRDYQPVGEHEDSGGGEEVI